MLAFRAICRRPLVPRPGGAQLGGAAGQRSTGSANRPPMPSPRPAGALGGMNDGARAGQYGNRGAQSQATQPRGGNAGRGSRPGDRGGARWSSA